MSECTLTREKMPLLLTEALDGGEREAAHVHIERCEGCGREWKGMRETWALLEADQDRPVPDRVRARFLSGLGEQAAPGSRGNVVAFWRRPAAKWLAQAAAIVTLVGGAYFTGTRTVGETQSLPVGAQVAAAQSQFSLAASHMVPAAQLAPEIEGKPVISNVRFIESPVREGEVGVSFDLTSNVTVTGSRDEKSFISLVSYLLQDRSNPTPAQSDAIQWVRQTYGEVKNTDPQLVGALANVLTSDSNEGVRLKAIEVLGMMQSRDLSGGAMEREALINALKNDPNPAIRIKAVEALASMLSGEGDFDAATVESLREKASQTDENPYVRIKAAEALSQLNL